MLGIHIRIDADFGYKVFHAFGDFDADFSRGMDSKAVAVDGVTDFDRIAVDGGIELRLFPLEFLDGIGKIDQENLIRAHEIVPEQIGYDQSRQDSQDYPIVF